MLRVPNTTSLRIALRLSEAEVFDGPPATGEDAKGVIKEMDRLEQKRRAEQDTKGSQ